MSNIQLIDAANVQAALSNTQIDAEATNGLLLNLHEALETLMTTQGSDPSEDAKASVMKKLNSLGQHLKKIYDQNDALPKANIQLYFYFLGMLNQDEVNNAELQSFLAQANNVFGSASAKSAQNQFEKAAEQYYKMTHRPWWKTLIDIVVKVVLPIVLAAVFIEDPAMLVGLTVMMAMQISGGTKSLGDEVAKGLEDIMPKHAAEMIGGIVSVGVNFALSLGTGAIASIETVGVEAGEDIAETAGTEMTDFASGETAETGGTSAEEAEEVKPRAKMQISERFQIDIKRMFSMAIMGGSAALAEEAPQIVTNFVQMLPVSEDMQKALAKTLLIILELVAVVGMIGGGMGSAMPEEDVSSNAIKEGMGTVAKKAGGYIDTYLPKVFNFFENNSDRLMKIGRISKHIATGTLGLAQVGNATYQVDQSVAEDKLGKYQAALTTALTDESMATSDSKSIVQYADQVMKGFMKMIREVGNLTQIYNDTAESLLNNS